MARLDSLTEKPQNVQNVDNLPERAYQILELLAGDPNLTQRALARQSGISHGLANIILRRCMRIGLVKAKSVDGRRLRYFVTPRGLRHVMRRSVQYVQKTLDSYRTLREGIETLVDRLRSEGKTHFLIIGEGDMPQIVRDVLASRSGLSYEMLAQPPAASVHPHPNPSPSRGRGNNGSPSFLSLPPLRGKVRMGGAERIPPANGHRPTIHGSTAVLDCRWNGGDVGVSVLHEILFKATR